MSSNPSSTSGGVIIPADPFAGMAWDNTVGALLIGGLVGGVLFGLTCMQSYMYFSKYKDDRLLLRFFVAVLWLLDAVDFAFNSHTLYFFLVTNYTNPMALSGKVPWSLSSHVLITTVVDFMIRAMFARKIFQLSNHNYLLTGSLLATSTLDLVVGIIITVRAFAISSIQNLEPLHNLFYVDFAAGTGSDLYVAVVLCYYLARSRTGFNTRTDSIVNILMLYTINTGLLTAIDAALGLITALVMPHNFVFVAFYLQLSKLYTNAYLATLNNRESLRERSTEPSGFVSVHLSRIGGRTGSNPNPTPLDAKVRQCLIHSLV
ncbi:hypothetical protein K488DRAFT_87669 [Vararia minispora EC-137]|uniref:Uncharacterized protein n=1 Tax=Vararia minispora EC-137 TaxID=1314806 RepID=A0ACB8QFV0_9AGAM|nr:hypothetical protein K488DRAFT_87669 [Vararia minispora EC-137]